MNSPGSDIEGEVVDYRNIAEALAYPRQPDPVHGLLLFAHQCNVLATLKPR